MRSAFLRVGASLLFITGLLAACSDSDPPTISSVGGRGSSSSGASGTSGSSGASGLPSSSSSSSSGLVPGAIDLDSIITITASEDVCGKIASECLDAQSFTIDFLKSTVTNTTCVQVAGDGGANSTEDATTSHAITTAQVDAVKTRLAALKTSSVPLTGFDGPIWTLEVSTKSSGTVIYSPNAGCGDQAKMIKIEAGWDDLWDALRGL